MQVQEQKKLSSEDVLGLINREVASVPYERVYYTLKQMRLKPLFHQTVDTMRLCLAIHNLGLRVTASLISTLRGCTRDNVLMSLHILGDKRCLTLLRGSRNRCSRWVVSADFLQKYLGETGE